MPVIKRDAATTEDAYPGVPRTALVDAAQGAKSLFLGHLDVIPGATIGTHIHPDTEEAMVIVEGELEALLGDETVTVGTGDTVLAPAGVKHGFVNRSGAKASLLAIFPKTEFQRVPVE
jgi:quercetin dioxygenase-like cupin family protein